MVFKRVFFPDQANGSFKVAVKPNTTSNTRETGVIMKGENLERKIVVPKMWLQKKSYSWALDGK